MTKLDEAGLKEVTAGIRPEQLELSDSGGIEGVVDLVEDLNSEAYLYTHAGSAYTQHRQLDPRNPQLPQGKRQKRAPLQITRPRRPPPHRTTNAFQIRPTVDFDSPDSLANAAVVPVVTVCGAIASIRCCCSLSMSSVGSTTIPASPTGGAGM